MVSVENGHEAFLKVKKSLQNLELLFDFVILDINMPICDGNSACKQIITLYEDKIVQHKDVDIRLKNLLPVIVGCTSDIITASVNVEKKKIGFRAMFNCPLAPSEIKETIFPLLY